MIKSNSIKHITDLLNLKFFGNHGLRDWVEMETSEPSVFEKVL